MIVHRRFSTLRANLHPGEVLLAARSASEETPYVACSLLDSIAFGFCSSLTLPAAITYSLACASGCLSSSPGEDWRGVSDFRGASGLPK